ncbi:hypothetical protein GLW07_18970 [Bacillus hwajinpoensis]|uniref:DUF3967 domain-containing protein n=1 Tax=Guptibacillus hwajinpoensis TaxID=208199 RepID=A0A845F461_9BACL|nr:hypothetical protein [Pseudalkalibacillus hwajinpoensis]MYL65445.1 hypothetical protein [Pseudalkalibacillus hwajinpoensis]
MFEGLTKTEVKRAGELISKVLDEKKTLNVKEINELQKLLKKAENVQVKNDSSQDAYMEVVIEQSIAELNEQEKQILSLYNMKDELEEKMTAYQYKLVTDHLNEMNKEEKEFEAFYAEHERKYGSSL